MKRVGAWADYVFLLAVFLTYLWTIAPFIYWRDSPEFVDVVTNLGIAHPAGFPTYNLMARWFWMFPIGNIAFRVNLFSAICAVAALGIFIRTSRLILESQGAKKDEACFISTGAAAILAVGYPFWSSSLSAEVYTLHLFFVSLLLHLALRWYFTGDDRFIYLCAFVYGLSAGNHATAALLLPGLLIFFCAKNREETLRKLLLIGIFFLVGFSVYLYLPIRSGTLPNMDWGEPRTLGQMLSHMTDRKDVNAHGDFLTGGAWGWWGALKMQGSKILDQITLLGVGLALAGIIWNLKRLRLVLVLLFLTAVLHGIFFVHWLSGNIHLQIFLVIGFWMAMGMRKIIELGENGKFFNIRPGKFLAPLLVMVLVLQTVLNYPRATLSDDRRVERSYRNDFLALQPDSLCVATALWFHFQAYQDVMRLREDVTVLGSSFFVAPEYFIRVTPERFPQIPVPDENYSRGESGNRFLSRLVAMNLDQDRPVYLEIYHALNRQFYRQILPERGFLFRFTPEPVTLLDREIVDQYIYSLRNRMLWEFETGGLMKDKEAYHYYIWFLLSIVDYLAFHNDWGHGLVLLEFMDKFFGDQGLRVLWPAERDIIDSNLAANYINIGKYEKAKGVLEGLVSRCKDCYPDYINLAWMYYRENRFKEAELWLQRGMKQKPVSSQALELMGDIHLAFERNSMAVESYRRALEKADNPGKKERLRKKIQGVFPDK